MDVKKATDREREIRRMLNVVTNHLPNVAAASSDLQNLRGLFRSQLADARAMNFKSSLRLPLAAP